MRVLYTALIMLFMTTTAVKSQITKGNWMFGGDAILQGFKFEDTEKFEYYAEVFPKAGYFLKDQFVVGGEIGLFFNDGTNYTSFLPFGRYYFFNNEKVINPFIEGGFGYKNITYPKSETTTISEFMYQFKAGTSVFFTNSVALNLTLNYKRNSFQFDQEISAALGFQIHLIK